MVGSTWTNPDQVVFLTNRLIDFVEAQNGKTLTAFWTTIWRDFFLQWPTPESESVPNGLDPSWNGTQKTSKKKKAHKTEEMIAPEAIVNSTDTNKWVGIRREVSVQLVIKSVHLCSFKSIKNWYNNHGLNKGKRRSGKNQTVTVALQQSTPRVLSERNMYSKLYYDERVKPTVEAEIGDRKISRTERFAIINKYLDEIYEQEPESLKEEIRRAIEADRQAKETERELSTSVVTADDSFGAKEYLLYVLYYLLA
jgi:hypothetical protein